MPLSAKVTVGLGCLAVAALAGLLLYAAMAYLHFASEGHVQGFLDERMMQAFDELSAYRKKNGKWPATLDEAAGQGFLFFDPKERVSDRPYLYNPEAKPGTKEILIAQPVPFEIEFWPFKETWQTGAAADGTVVNLGADGVGVDHLK